MTKRRYDAAAQTKPETPIARHEINTPFVIRLLLLLLRFPSFVFVASFWCFAVSSSSLSLSLLLSSLSLPDRRRLALLSAAFSLVSTLGNGNEDDDVLFSSKVDDFFDGGGFGVLGYFPRRVSSRAGPLSVVVVVVVFFFFFFSSEDEDKKVGREGSKVEKVVVFVVLSSKTMRRLMRGVLKRGKKKERTLTLKIVLDQHHD